MRASEQARAAAAWLFGAAPPGLSPAAVCNVIGLATRLVFASTLFGYFWTSALTKLEGWSLSVNAYAQILPRQTEAAGYDVEALGLLAHLIVATGTMMEFVLPLLIILGLFTRLASLAMVVFIAVMSWTDIAGHHVGTETIGALFDRFPDAMIADQRVLWVWALAALALTGGGFVSADRLILRRKQAAM